MYSIPLSVIMGIVRNSLWSHYILQFGILIGLIGFKYFKKNEYYTYCNLGY